MRHWIASGRRRMNGVAERMNRTIISKTRMLSNARMNKRFWAEAANTTCYLINRGTGAVGRYWNGSPSVFLGTGFSASCEEDAIISSEDGPTPLNPNGEQPFKYCATTPKSLFGAISAPLSKVILKANPPWSTKRPRETTTADAKIPKYARKVLAVKKLEYISSKRRGRTS